MPGLVFVATDTRHYLELSAIIYRLTPILAEPVDLDGLA